MVYIVSSGINILLLSSAFPVCFKPLSVTYSVPPPPSVIKIHKEHYIICMPLCYEQKMQKE